MICPIYDAHLHVPNTDKSAISVLLRDMDEWSIEKGVLIVNTDSELEAVRNDICTFLENQNRLHVVSGVNIKKDDPLSIYDFFRQIGVNTDIKLHPKMYGYTMGDFQKIINTLSGLAYQVVTIDALYFGEQLENHIGIELAIKIAQTFPEKRIVIAHSGFIRLLECQMLTRNLKNIFYDLSFTSSYINHTSVRLDMVNFLKHTDNRIMYGSDYPDFDFDRARLSLEELCSEAELSNEAMSNVFYNNALKVYWNNIIT